MRRIELAVLFDKGQEKIAFSVENCALVGEGFVPLLEQMQPEIPFGAVEFRSVEFVVPDEFPFFSRGEQAFCVIGHVLFLLFRG